MTYYIKQYVRLVWIVALLILVGGCTSADKQALSAEEVVKTRAAERWNALIEGKLETAYGYELPDYRKVFTYEQFLRNIHGGGIWQKAEVKNVACTETCVVTMQIYVTMKLAGFDEPMNASSMLEEKWMKDEESGDWFHLSSK